MAKLTLKNPGANFRSTTQIEDNNDLIEAAIENTLSRDGTSPNQMEANLDMNSNRILNLPEPVNNSEPYRKIDIDSGIGPEITVVASNADDVATVADDIANVNTVADDLNGSDSIGAAAALVNAGSPGIPHIDSVGSVSLLTYGTGLSLSGGELLLDAELEDVSSLNPGDGEFIVGNGSAFVTESGETARTSLGSGVIGDDVFQATDQTSFWASLGADYASAADGQALVKRSGSVEFETLSGNGDVLAAANETITGDWNFTGDLTFDGEPVMKKPDGFINVQDYGVDLTGATADTTAINNAVSALVAEGGGTLYFPPGTYNHPTEIEITDDNIVLEFAPGAVFDCSSLSYNASVRASGNAFEFKGDGPVADTTISSAGSKGDDTVVVADATGIAVGQILVIRSDEELQAQGGEAAFNTHITRVTSVSGTTIGIQHMLERDLPVATFTVDAKFYTPIKGCGVKGKARFEGGGVDASLSPGLGRVGIAAQAFDEFSVEGQIEFDGFQGYAIYADKGLGFSCSGLNILGLPEDETAGAGQEGFYGVVTNRVRDVLMKGSVGTRVRHVFDGAECHFMQQESSAGYETHGAAFGCHEGVFELYGDRLYSSHCHSGWINRAFSMKLTNFDFLDCTTRGIYDQYANSGDVPGSMYVEFGTITVPPSSANAVQLLGAYDGFVFRHVRVEAGARPMSLRFQTLKNFDISHNTLKQLSGAAFRSCMEFTSLGGSDAPLEHIENGKLNFNTLIDYTQNGITFQGADDVTQPADNIEFVGNVGIPGSGGTACIFLADGFWYGDHILTRGNQIIGSDDRPVFVDTSDNGRFRSSPIVLDNYGAVVGEGVTSYGAERVVGEGTGTTLTGSATVLQGSIIRRRNPGDGDNTEWICTTAGTEGSFSGVTGSISSGSTTLTLTGNDAVKAYVGSFVTVAGAGAGSADLTSRIVSISADYATATLATAASTTVSGAAVTRSNPVWAESGIINNPIKVSAGFAGVGPATLDANWHVSTTGNTTQLISSSFSNAFLDARFDSPGNGTQGFTFRKGGSTDGYLRYIHAASISDKYLSFNVGGGADVLRVWGNDRVAINTETAPGYTLDVDGDVNAQSGHVYRVNGDQVVGAQQSAIADLNQTTSNPPTQAQVQAISDKVDAVLGMLRTHGLIAT